MNKAFLEFQQSIDSLAVFGSLKTDPVICGLRDLFASLARTPSLEDQDLVRQYSDVLAALYPHGSDLSAYIRDLVLSDDNFYVQAIASGQPLSDEIQEAARRELNLLQDLGALDCFEVKEAIDYDGYLPSWSNSKLYLISDFMQKLERIPVTGYGIFAEYTFFRVGDESSAASGSSGHGLIVPVAHPDVQPLRRLFGYEREQQMILRNTEALLDGTGASNMLLYGDAGTGKSSTIKAVAAEYSDRGLRIIEIKKNQLYLIPEVVDLLAGNPLKFILFIDDLSFSSNDDNFSALKATLEGSVAGCAGNTVIYATSNRRHLVKETFADRTGDELHVNDTLQETMSLAARFGLTITFSKPSKEEYLNIVRAMAVEYGIDIPDEELVRRAEAHAIRRNGRSPRTAKQLIELLKIGM